MNLAYHGPLLLVLFSFVTMAIGRSWRCGVNESTSWFQLVSLVIAALSHMIWPAAHLSFYALGLSAIVGIGSVFTLWYGGPVKRLGKPDKIRLTMDTGD